TAADGAPASAPVPGGKVVFHRYATSDCTGTKVDDETVALATDGTAESRAYTVATDTSYRADYLGDASYAAAVGVWDRLRPLFLPPPGLSVAKCPLRPATPCVKRDAGDPRDLQEVLEGVLRASGSWSGTRARSRSPTSRLPIRCRRDAAAYSAR